MAEKVYVLVRIKYKEARWELSEEEAKSLSEKREKAFEEAGGKMLTRFAACSSEWKTIRVNVFPDMEAWHKFWKATRELNGQRYLDTDITLGFEPPA